MLVTIEGRQYELVPVKPESVESIIDLGPGNLEPKTNENEKEATKRPGSGIRKAEGKPSEYRKKFLNKQLSVSDFPKMPDRPRVRIKEFNTSEMDAIESKAGYAQDSTWFGKGTQIDIY